MTPIQFENTEEAQEEFGEVGKNISPMMSSRLIWLWTESFPKKEVNKAESGPKKHVVN